MNYHPPSLGPAFGIFFLILSFISFTGCDAVSPQEDEAIYPSQPDALTEALVIPGATHHVGTLPSASSSPRTPKIKKSLDTQITANGSSFALPISYRSTAKVAGVYLHVEGASTYFNVPMDALLAADASLTVPVALHSRVQPGSFCTSYNVYDAKGRVSPPVTTCVDVLEVGSGALQFSLAWNTPDTDLDLQIVDPSGERIHWFSPTSSAGGHLDRDDRDGFGPENIFWAKAPDGTYTVEVDYYDGSTPTDFIVTVTTDAPVRQYRARLHSDREYAAVARVVKKGDRLRFEPAMVPGAVGTKPETGGEGPSKPAGL